MITYELLLDGHGRKYWIARHDDGESEPMPPDFALSFPAGALPGGGESYPLGTVVRLELPSLERSCELAVAAHRERLRATIRETFARACDGAEPSEEEIERSIDRLLADLHARGQRAPARLPPPPPPPDFESAGTSIDIPIHTADLAADVVVDLPPGTFAG